MVYRKPLWPPLRSCFNTHSSTAAEPAMSTESIGHQAVSLWTSTMGFSNHSIRTSNGLGCMSCCPTPHNQLYQGSREGSCGNYGTVTSLAKGRQSSGCPTTALACTGKATVPGGLPALMMYSTDPDKYDR